MFKKSSPKKIYIAIILVAILAVSTTAAVYVYSDGFKPKKAPLPGVQAGDVFTYNITDVSTLYSADANPDSMQPGFNGFNNTVYTVTISDVTNATVSYDTKTVFANGTSLDYSGSVNITSGVPSGNAGFWGIFPAHLAIGNLVNLGNTAGPKVQDVGNQTFSDSFRQVNYFSVEQNATSTLDPTGNTMKQEITSVTFDQSTGILTNLQDINEYNNPMMTLTTTWVLVTPQFGQYKPQFTNQK